MVSSDKEFSPRLLVASRKELKVFKLEIDSLYIYEEIARNTGAIIRFDTAQGRKGREQDLRW